MNNLFWHNNWSIRRYQRLYPCPTIYDDPCLTIYDVYHKHYQSKNNHSQFTVTTSNINQVLNCGVCGDSISPIDIKKLLLLNL